MNKNGARVYSDLILSRSDFEEVIKFSSHTPYLFMIFFYVTFIVLWDEMKSFVLK